MLCNKQKLLQEVSSARVLQVLLTSCLQGCKGTAFNLFSNLSFPHTPCSFPVSVSCRLRSRHSVPTSWEFSPEQVGNSHWNKLAFHGISPTYQVTYLLISAPYESTSLDVNKANRRLTSNAKGTFCDNVRRFATNCSDKSHLQECFKCS